MTGARLRDRIAHHASRLGPGLRPEPLARAVTNALDVHPRLVTFDVFDTLVQRRVVGEDNRLALVGHLLGADGQWTGSASAFARARRQAVGGAASLALEQIYPAVEPAFADAQQAITTELTSEGLLVRAVPGAAQALRRVRDAGVPVAMVSDTDLSADQLTDLLDGVGLLAASDRVFSSSTEQVSKLEGSLFARVAGSYEISPSDIVHLGDGRWNDVTMARQAGCRARWVDHAAPTRFERALAEGGVIGAAVAGAARRARLDLEAGEPEHHRLERLGADVAGGAFSAFLLWLRQQVEAEGLGQVAFLARDGRLLHDMAHDMPSDHWEGFDLHYLRASRRAWLLAAASAVGVHEWIEVGCRTPDAFIHHSRHDIPFRSLLARIGLDPDDLDQHPELAALDPGRPLPPRLVPAWEAMLGHDTIAQAIGHRSTARRELILDHLADLGLPPAPFAVVDVGWKGQFGWLVGSVLSAHTGHRCVHFHIGGDQVVPDLEQLVEIRRFAFNDLERPHPFHSPVHCVETFTSSGEERVIDYRRAESGVVEPVVGPAVVAIDTGHRRALWSAARATATLLPSRAELSQWGGGRIEPGLELVEATRAVLTLMWEHPEPADAESLRTLGFETDEVGASIAPLARPYRLIELVTSAEGIPRSWRQGSIELTPRWLRAVLRRAVRLKGS